MRACVVVLAFAVLAAAAGCGGSSSGTPPSTAPGEQMTVTAYFLRDGVVAPAHVRVPQTSGVARASLEALFDGPPAGFDTDLPSGLDDFDVSIAAGQAELSLRRPVELTPTARAEI